MKKKRNDVENDHKIYENALIKIEKENNGTCYFEINNEITTDLAEAVSLLMRFSNWNDKIWDTPIIINSYNIEPYKCLYWLSGGKEEWTKLDNYKIGWYESYLTFQEKFGTTVISIVEKAKNLRDIRNGFLKYLNLPIIYNFAIESGISK